jgi:hypothetical protein
MTDFASPISALCPMCGSENEFPPDELAPAKTGARWGELDTLLRGNCRSCGEPIDVTASASPDGAAPTASTAGRGEAIIAFAVLAALLLIFLLAVFVMDRA